MQIVYEMPFERHVERTRECQFSVSFDSTIRTSRANLRIGPQFRTRCSRGLDEDIGAISVSIGKLHSYSFSLALSPWHQWTAYVNEITLYAEFFLVIDFLSVLNYSDVRQEWSSGLVLCVWVLENFISYKTDVVDISSGHIGFSEGQ